MRLGGNCYGLESRQHQDPNRTMRLQRVQIIKVETFMCLRSTQSRVCEEG